MKNFVPKYLSQFYIFFLFLSFFFSYSQSIQLSNRPSINIQSVDKEPLIDGDIINDMLWNTINPITNLYQMSPNYQELSTEKTEIRVAYNEKKLFVSVICFDSDPENIVISDSTRDSNLEDEDSFFFIIDTYDDQQNGFLFGTNANGVEYDAQITNEGQGNFAAGFRQQGGAIGGTNINWDSTWQVKSKVGEYGWSAEFEIPLKSIRFAEGDKKSWGINFNRRISKNSESSYWAMLPIGFNIKRVSLAGKLNGLNLKSTKNLKLTPYALVNATKNKVSEIDSGADLKYSITPALTLDLTYNTDFAQVEVDEQQVNLDRFNLFFPEKRSFFLENAGQFSVGSPGEIDLFFSRRIGIDSNGEMVPIIGGSRLSGKIKETNIGLLSMFTDEVPNSNINKNNFTVARINHEFSGTRSSIGGIWVNKDSQNSILDKDNSVFAFDGKLGLGKKAQIFGFLSKSNTPGIDSDDYSYKIKGEYKWDGWNIAAGYTELGQGFNPEVGFLSRSAFKKPEFLIFKTIRVNNMGKMLEVRPHIWGNSYKNFNNQLISSFLHIDNHWVWESSFEIHTGINFVSEGVFEEFSIKGVKIPPGNYSWSEFMPVIMTNKNKKIYFYSRLRIGGYFGGNRFSASNRAKIQFNKKFNSELNFDYNKLNLPNGDVTALVSGGRIIYSFTPKIFIQSYIQYNNISNVFSVNTKFGWTRSANTGLFLVFNSFKDNDFFDKINYRSIILKYSYQFDLL
tara:strand:- start:72819 stop:75023 length:2205 start_codon:yes stop_codon:yes gene_type:complete